MIVTPVKVYADGSKLEDLYLRYMISHYYVDALLDSKLCPENRDLESTLKNSILFLSTAHFSPNFLDPELSHLVKVERFVNLDSFWLSYRTGLLEYREACELLAGDLMDDMSFLRSKIEAFEMLQD